MNTNSRFLRKAAGIAGLVLCMALLATTVSAQWTQLGSNIAGEAAEDRCGISVSFSSDGSRLAIGAHQNDGSAAAAGHVRVYEWGGTDWVQLGADLDGEAAGDYFGYSVSLSANGSRVAIGAYKNDGNGTDAGHVRVYEWGGASWSQLGSDIDGEAGYDWFGYSVSLSWDGSLVAVGAPYNDAVGDYSGHAQVYEWGGVSWSQLGSDMDGEAANDLSGFSVSLSWDGSRLAIGAPSNDGVNGQNSGHVRVHEWGGMSWSQLGSDIDGEAASDASGIAISLSPDGSRVAIGANQNNGGGSNSGHVRVFEWNGVSWSQLGADLDGDAANDYSGSAVSMSWSGTRVAIGAASHDYEGANTGQVRIYEWTGSSWSQDGSDIYGETAGDASGASVALSWSGSRVALGALSNDDGGTDSGHVRVFRSPLVFEDGFEFGGTTPWSAVVP